MVGKGEGPGLSMHSPGDAPPSPLFPLSPAPPGALCHAWPSTVRVRQGPRSSPAGGVGTVWARAGREEGRKRRRCSPLAAAAVESGGAAAAALPLPSSLRAPSHHHRQPLGSRRTRVQVRAHTAQACARAGRGRAGGDAAGRARCGCTGRSTPLPAGPLPSLSINPLLSLELTREYRPVGSVSMTACSSASGSSSSSCSIAAGGGLSGSGSGGGTSSGGGAAAEAGALMVLGCGARRSSGVSVLCVPALPKTHAPLARRVGWPCVGHP